ncbi:MAG: hypothetical protein ABSD75_09055 [Terriglobales bacterium]
MRVINVILVCRLLVAVFCAAQSTPDSPPSAADPSAQQPPATVGQTPQQTPAPAKPSTGQPSQPGDQSQGEGKDTQSAKDAANGGTASGTSKDRLFFALPNFLTVENAGKIPPLTTGQKFKVVAQGSFDPVLIAWYAALSGISQAEDSEDGYGQGAAGFGKRYGAYAADGTIENFFVGAILPSVLHQDPRFFPKGQGSFSSRTEYAVSRIFITRSDSGHRQFNFSEMVGAALASTISTYSYHPRADRTVGNTASVWGSQVGYDTVTLVVKEFWPDIRRKLKKQH